MTDPVKVPPPDAEWPPRFKMADMTPAQAAKMLRDLCELTVKGSRDWDNMQEIFESVITSAYKGGQIAGPGKS